MKARFALCLLAVSALLVSARGGEDAFTKYSKPGAEHKMLAKFAGTWKAHVKFWIKPGEAPDESDGVMKKKMILGGRFLQEDYSGEAAGQKFIGMGLVGYDLQKKKFTSIWTDTMSTSIMHSLGTYDAEAKTFNYQSEVLNPATGKETKSRELLRVIDDNELVYEMYWQMGKDDFKVMEIAYKREAKKDKKDKAN